MTPNELARAALLEDRVRDDLTTAVLRETLRRAGRSEEQLAQPRDFVIKAKVDGIFAGGAWARAVCEEAGLELRKIAPDGLRVGPADIVLEGRGTWESVLATERTLLNGLLHLSGIASRTRRFVTLIDAAWKRSGSTASAPGLFHTRKTFPLFRDLEREAVVAGGGQLHRRDLAESVLFKENHKEVLRSQGLSWADLVTTLGGARLKTSLIEVETPLEARAVVDAGARFVMLDNFTPAQVRETVATLPADVVVEVSGGLDLDTIVDYALPGVHRLSVGSLTHSAPSLDLSLDWAAGSEAGA